MNVVYAHETRVKLDKIINEAQLHGKIIYQIHVSVAELNCLKRSRALDTATDLKSGDGWVYRGYSVFVCDVSAFDV